ncbi:hypothetical protein [uncultured Alteromonas sp.]|jgi:hypothetical protein|uniref:hypothetical protein n=1 Tax=uncultured Alteromonas sp. TaxID=179113 RepID=UPI0030D3EDC9|tara:strand:+ start:2490 stop:3011 length:522 start_codon:yes stop_codon:yes gene_type:complete
MHEYTDLAERCASFTLKALKEANEKRIQELQSSGATSLVIALQMIQLQKAILAVGMFSMFEANLQENLKCNNGFQEAKEILDSEGENDLKSRFINYIEAVNILKHGHGRSYNSLVSRADTLPFNIKQPGQNFFFEGDVSEISTLIEVDDDFVNECGSIVSEVSEVMLRAHPEF